MRAVFISYRREDAEGQAGRLFDDLVMHFGEDSVFMDVAGIEPGRDFRRAIDEQVASCGVLLAVIGKGWLDAKDESGRRRLDDPTDFVRLETASALKRDIPVIPVLVRGASMPRAEQLPPDLAELAYRNAVELTHARWDSDVQVLIKALRPHVELLQKDVGSAKTEPAVRVPGKTWTAGTVDPSGEPGAGGTAPVAAARSAKKTWPLIVAVAAIVVAAGGYVGYEKVAEKAKPDGSAEDEKVAADQGRKPEPEKVPDAPTRQAEPEKVPAGGGTEASVPANQRGPESKPTPQPTPQPRPSPPALPTSYTLAGTWEDDQGHVFATVADPKQGGVFEMEQIKPRKEQDTLWKATLKGREVEIDVFAMPSGSHQVHMQLELSLDGNRMAGLSHPGGASPEDEPPAPVHFRRIN